VFFAREAGAVHFSYQRYLENRIRDEFGFLGTPIRLVFRERTAERLERRAAKGRRGAPRPRGGGPAATGGRAMGRRTPVRK
jgi:hypothetical protein